MFEIIRSTTQNNPTMSSREIAELTGKEHKNVLADIRKMLEELGKSSAEFSAYLPDSYGRLQPGFNLPHDETICLIAGYDIKARMAIIKRWQELESSQFAIPKTLSGALMLAAKQAEQIEQQQALIEQQKPAVEFVDRFVEAKSSKGLREVAKIFGWKEREFIHQLESDGIIFRLGGNWVPSASYQHRGYFVVKVGEANGHAYKQMRFTPDGIVWVTKRYAQRSAA